MPRKANHEGCVYRRPDGRWCASLAVAGRRLTLYGKTRQEVVEKLRQLQQQTQQAGHLPDAGKLTLTEYLTTWLGQAQERLRPKTVTTYRQLLELHILPQLGQVKLSRLTGLQLVSTYARLRKQGVSAWRVYHAHAVLHKALADAVKWGLLTSNPAGGVDRPQPQPAERSYWTADQVQAFLAAVERGEAGQYGDLFAFLLASGCRLGEALALRWSDVDWRTGTIHIERQVTEVAGKPVEGPPKSQAGRRGIVLPSWGLAALERQRARAGGWQLQSDNAFAEGWQRCFPTPRGTVPEATNVRRALHRVCDQLGLPRVRTHDLRHISLSLLAAAGVPVKDLQRRAGHSNSALTLEVYLHTSQDADRRVAAVLERLLKGGDERVRD